MDVVERKVVASYALPNCEAPTGLAWDAETGALISACNNNVAKVLDGKTGRDLATLKIGKGPDGVLLDAKRRRAFIPAADGTLTVLSLSPTITIAETVLTAMGAKTGALDPVTGDVYLPTANSAVTEKEGERARAIPGTFNIVVVSGRN
ncbi:hypothetical protein [Methylosinus sporium]|uniref:hypothetical protein n=1 Tax=Methylosinus sporium TaxID=428 RepID=UPI000D58E219|nr:hypothetical protein [Methylosinus sporium]PWB88431.1 hypothetical protein C5688_21115 [Methylocystis sp. MitZ-2018]